MQIEKLAVAVRPRRPWEAVDLGFHMVRAWWKPLFGTWLALVLPVAVILNVVLSDHLWAAGLLLWWCKPLFERALLFIVSRGVFGVTPTIRDARR